MKKAYNNKNMKDILESMKGSNRAKPNPDLFAKIEANIDTPEAKVVPMYFKWVAAAAAISLLVVNAFVLQQFAQNTDSFADDRMTTETFGQSLISNYKIYE